MLRLDKNLLDNALELIQQGVDKGYFPGATVAIGDRKGVYVVRQYGKACIYPSTADLDKDTLYDLASLTKVVGTTTLFMKFLEMGLVTLDDRVEEYIPKFSCGKKSQIRLFNLLTHTSGLPAYLPLYKMCCDYNDVIRCIGDVNLEYDPGTKVVYSDLGFILLRYILEKAGHAPFERLCDTYVFKPIGMENTCFNPKTKNVAATEIDINTGRVLIGKCHDENGRFLGGISGHAGLFSNICDLINFGNMLINRGTTLEGRFLSIPAFEMMTRNYTAGLNEDRGIGWCVKGSGGRISSGGDLVSPSAFGHTGFTGTSIWVDIPHNIYIILLTNRVHPSRRNDSIIRFRRVFHNAVLSSIVDD